MLRDPMESMITPEIFCQKHSTISPDIFTQKVVSWMREGIALALRSVIARFKEYKTQPGSHAPRDGRAGDEASSGEGASSSHPKHRPSHSPCP